MKLRLEYQMTLRAQFPHFSPWSKVCMPLKYSTSRVPEPVSLLPRKKRCTQGSEYNTDFFWCVSWKIQTLFLLNTNINPPFFKVRAFSLVLFWKRCLLIASSLLLFINTGLDSYKQLMSGFGLPHSWDNNFSWRPCWQKNLAAWVKKYRFALQT
jgi:hypothetical protein